MHDLHAIRQNPDRFRLSMIQRGESQDTVDRLLLLDQQVREQTTQVEELLAERNRASGEMAQLARDRKTEAMRQQQGTLRTLRSTIEAINTSLATLRSQRDDLMLTLPNVADPKVPVGHNENNNVILRSWGDPAQHGKKDPALSHSDPLSTAGCLDTAMASQISGSRFIILRGALARLERALSAFMIDLHTTTHGYTEVSPPLLVRPDALLRTGQLPKFADDVFETTDGRYLIPTAEVSLTNMVAEQELSVTDLPLRFTASTPCFRREAGAAGRDTQGLIRLHQFHKVELVSITTPEQSNAEFERMTHCAQTVLEKLGLPYQVVALCTGDMGFGARQTWDLEVWMASSKMFREISSCSHCGDFQARRMRARFRQAPQAGDHGKGKMTFVHTLNGSALAVGRTMAALLESYLESPGYLWIPEVLRPYLGGGSHLSLQPASDDPS